MPKNRDRTTGLPFPTPVDPGSYTYLCLPVPNHTLYRQALSGVLAELGKPWNWQQTVGEGDEGARQAAEVWRKAVSLAVYTDGCGGGMSCEDVADCIETSPTVRNAIGSIVSPRSPIAAYTYPPGDPLPTSAMTEPLNPIDECAFNAFWAQVEQYVDYMVNLGQDTLEQLEFYSNALEAGENVPMGALVGKLKSGTTTGKVMEFLNWLGEVMKEAYEASNTEANRTALKCDLFCAFRDTCSITIQGTLDVINTRVGGLFTPTALNSLPELAEMMTTVALNSAIALDVWIGFLMGTAKTASLFGVQGIDETLNLMLAVAVNDANNDWEILCEDCAPDTPNISFIGTFAPSYDGSPQTFIGNTPTGGSIWDLTFQNINGTIAVAVTAVNAASNPICVLITSTTNVVTYQHNLCAGGAETGTTENPTTEYGPNLGWFGAAGGSVMRVTVEPV